MNIDQLYQLFLTCGKVCTDTRNIIPGSIFFALKGETFDGNTYAHEALKKGAKYAVVDNPEIHGENILYINNVLLALQDLAALHRQKSSAVIIGITGTNGKTTTKELVSAVLSAQKKIIFTQGNLNNHIGVPLTLLTIQKETEYAVIEMGANHPGEIDFLCNIADPDYGLITNVGKAHLEGFGSFEGVVSTKTELYRYLHARNRKAFVNNENNILFSKANKDHDIFYGSDVSAIVSGKVVKNNPFIEIEWCGKDFVVYSCATHLIGNYNFENILAAITIGSYFGLDALKINQALEAYVPSNHRSQLVKTEKNEILLDAYNANPSSMRVAIENFKQIERTDKVMILGDMFELGLESPIEHKAVLSRLEELKDVTVLLAGKNYLEFAGSFDYHFFKTTSELKDYLILHPVQNSFKLVKGSRGMKMEQVLDVL
ncbi:MAG: UDP-N-acetylmuramoyl-tripeptide--D-alanyl-D-alanine ligase [Bacteroidetes bacterium HGW-Bacteroidetes-21]|nr:MAG: UDP-N-acetylmuramoyl-tripeptide--D-alanyl-D-alanine ligase [Bacteroidetes bacterium HGW-Bacteroidetes-21]